MALLEKLHKIKHPDHPTGWMAGMIMTPAAFLLMSTRIWALPKEAGEFFEVLQSAITDTDQQTEERKWIAKKLKETNYDNLDTCLVAMCE